jgi:hypothetical protein
MIALLLLALAEPHPRLWIRAGDLPKLHARATDDNPLWGALKTQAENARQRFGGGRLEDCKNDPCEKYAELLAFMSLVEPDGKDDARRARTLLLRTVSQTEALGEFATGDRSRWTGEAFALTADWIYPSLSAADRAQLRRVFLRWSNAIAGATTTSSNHPEPIGVTNDPRLVANRHRVRFAGNNYFTAHARNLGLMALALDRKDDPDGVLHAQLKFATGAWLYMIEHLLRGDSRGGLGPEGFEYGPQTLAYVAQLYLALETSGNRVEPSPFWRDVVPAWLHSLSPGEPRCPDWYGDGQEYHAPDPIDLMAPLALLARARGDAATDDAIRWLETAGQSGTLRERANRDLTSRGLILAFLLLDGRPEPADPRPKLPLVHVAEGLGHILARTGWDRDARWFTYRLGWSSIDHQHADGNDFGFFRKGEWLTKERTGYGFAAGATDRHNAVAIENDQPDHHEPNDYRFTLWKRGSQWPADLGAGDGKIVALSRGPGLIYAAGDASALYVSPYEKATAIEHASRSILWLEPDHVIVLDRVRTRDAKGFKRFYLQLPATPQVEGRRATMISPGGQRLFVTTLLPADAKLFAEPPAKDPDAAHNEPMRARLRVEPAHPAAQVTFLHVLQGTDGAADPVSRFDAPTYQGVLVRGVAILLPAELGAPAETLSYRAPDVATEQIVAGLLPNATYDVTTRGRQITIRRGTKTRADEGGVLRSRIP